MKSFSVLLLGCFFVSCANQPSKTDRENENFKGLVKSVLTIEYNALDKFGEGKITRNEPSFWGSEYVLFDSIGNYLKQYSYSMDNAKKSSKYIYDENGFNIRYEFYDDEGKNVSWGYKIINDEKGTEIETIDLKDGTVHKGDAKYDENGNLVFHNDKYSKTYYEYIDNKLIEKKEVSHYGTITNTTYKYDNNGNMIERRCSWRDNKMLYQYTYDDKNRLALYKINEINNKTSDVELDEILKYYYSSDSTKNVHIVETWDKNGELKDKNYYFCVHNHIDTISCITLDTDFKIKKITNIVKLNNQEETIHYNVKSSFFQETNYTVVNGKKVSSIDDNGWQRIYEYQDDELIKLTHNFEDEKRIILYENGKEKSSILYDKHNKVISSNEVEYSGNLENGRILTTSKDKNGKVSTNEVVVENGKITKQNYVVNGIPSTVIRKYNSFGDIIESTEGADKTTYEYQYDKFNNWITQYKFVNGKIKNITDRAIIYY